MKRYSDVVSGGAVTLFGIVMLIETKSIRELGILEFGPKIVPQMLSVALIFLGLAIAVIGLRRVRQTEAGSKPEEHQRIDGRRVFLVCTLIALYVFLLEPVGFVIATALFLFLQFLVLGGVRVRRLPIYGGLALALTLGIHWLFVNVFDVFLPPGLLS